MVPLVNGVLSDELSSKRLVENGNCSIRSGLPYKYKPRKISAVRDFPPGCGRNAPLVNVAVNNAPEEVKLAEGEEGHLETGEAKNVLGATCHNPSDIEVTSNFPGVSSVPVKPEMYEASDDVVSEVVLTTVRADGVENLCAGPVLVDIAVAETVGNDELTVSKESHELGAQAFIKEGLHEPEGSTSIGTVDTEGEKIVLEIGVLSDKTILAASAKLWSPANCPINDINSLDEPLLKNKFYKRRISATRDFPSFCGRNAPPPNKEDRLKVISGNKGLNGMEKAALEHGSSTETVGIRLGGGALDGRRGAGGESVPVRVKVNFAGEESEGVLQEDNEENIELKGIMPELTNKFQEVRSTYEEDVSMLARKPARGIATKASGLLGKVGKEIVTYTQDKMVKKRPPSSLVGSNSSMDRVIVQGLMAAPFCPWRQGKGALTNLDGSRKKVKSSGFTKKQKSRVFRSNNHVGDDSGRKSLKGLSASTDTVADGYTGALISLGEEEFAANMEEQSEGFPSGPTVHNVDVTLPPYGPNRTCHGDARTRVREALRLYQAIFRKLLQGEEAKQREGEATQSKQIRRIDLTAAKIIKDREKEVNTGIQYVGAVPGVEVGDEFQYRVELAIVGVHRLYQAGIDYIKQGGKIIATSIVASGGYADDLDDADKLIYSGSGGNVVGKDKKPEDQKLERGNLALKNSIHEKNHVRVIRGYKESKTSDSDSRAKIVTNYIYDGLYTVQNYWSETGSHGKLVYKFELRRIPGQPELAWKEVKSSKKFKTRDGLCVDDVSEGKELLPIGAVNTLDEEKPPTFHYITRMIYPDWYQPIPPKGCDCTGRCSDSQKCLCAMKNGGEIPFNHNGAIVEAKTLVYECGPSCKCPPSCYNRVSQHGIKIPLEVFKTESRGWGVRSLDFIPSGSFICEYTGELLEDKEAEQRTVDTYLFDIGQNYNDCSQMPDAPSGASVDIEDVGFTIDALQYGNVGRFINHSCSPNLYAQNVLYDHEDKRMPHIMLFAAENIPPLQELTYHYNYSLDQVHDSSGNIKMKSCYCGSADCTGRMY